MSKVIHETPQFWMVWTKSGHKPRACHPTEEFALAEAQRLACKFPTKKFIVLRATHKFYVPALVTEAAE